jgi:hypothetical protein
MLAGRNRLVFLYQGLIKIRGTVNGRPFQSSFMPMGNGNHLLPIKADIRKKDW